MLLKIITIWKINVRKRERYREGYEKVAIIQNTKYENRLRLFLQRVVGCDKGRSVPGATPLFMMANISCCQFFIIPEYYPGMSQFEYIIY